MKVKRKGSVPRSRFSELYGLVVRWSGEWTGGLTEFGETINFVVTIPEYYASVFDQEFEELFPYAKEQQTLFSRVCKFLKITK